MIDAPPPETETRTGEGGYKGGKQCSTQFPLLPPPAAAAAAVVSLLSRVTNRPPSPLFPLFPYPLSPIVLIYRRYFWAPTPSSPLWCPAPVAKVNEPKMVALGRGRRKQRGKGGLATGRKSDASCSACRYSPSPPFPLVPPPDGRATQPSTQHWKKRRGNTFFFLWSALATLQYEQSPVASPSFSSSPLDGAVGRSWGGGWPQQRDGPPDSPHRWRTLSAAVLQLTGQIGVRVGVLLLLLLLHPHISRMHAGMTTRGGRTAAGHGIAGERGADVLDACSFFYAVHM